MVEQFRRYYLDKVGHMDERTNGRTDGWMDEVIPTYSLYLSGGGGGYNKHTHAHAHTHTHTFTNTHMHS